MAQCLIIDGDDSSGVTAICCTWTPAPGFQTNTTLTQFSASPDFHEAMMTAVVKAYDNHMSMSEQVLKRDNVKAVLKEILKDMVYEGCAKRLEAGQGT
jgi:hypothetical protein